MPEGPEIRRAADLLQTAVCGKALQRVWFKFPHLKQHEAALSASVIERFETRGKALMTHFDCGLSIYSHNQLYGVWKIAKRGKAPSTTRDLRLSLHVKPDITQAAGAKSKAPTSAPAIFLYSASDISVWRTDALVEHPFLRKLGPDALDTRLQTDQLAARLREKRFAGKALAALLLDQTFLAGMGNYLRTEVLFYAQLHPNRSAKDLNDVECERLAEMLLSVTRRSYETGGVTNEAAIAPSYQDGVPFEQYRFAAFERAGKPCQHCGHSIQRLELAGRRLYICSECQVL
jgi:endonuclease VIII